jgi:hypothetical protein
LSRWNFTVLGLLAQSISICFMNSVENSRRAVGARSPCSVDSFNPANIKVHPSNDVLQGDEGVLAPGTYQGTLGVFVNLSADIN